MSSMDVLLKVVAGPRRGLRFRASGRRSITIGRSKRTDFHVLDGSMSRVHAELVELDDAWFIEDLGSSNGVWFDDRQVRRRQLVDGDVIRLGHETEIEFRTVSSEEREPGEVILMADGSRLVAGQEHESLALEDLPGRRLGDFKVQERLRGNEERAFFKASQPTLGRPVVLEVFAAGSMEEQAVHEALLEGVRRASRYVHPNVLQILDFVQERGLAIIAFEHFEAQNLLELLRHRRFIKIRAAAAIAEHVLEALRYAREQGSALHGLQPTDVFVNARHEVKVRLFREPPLPGTEASATDISYRAPEDLREDVGLDGERVAIYSVGAMLYHMLSGIPPFEGGDPAEVRRRVLHENPPSLRRINLKVSPRLATAVETAIRRNPAERHESVEAFLEQLRAAVRGR